MFDDRLSHFARGISHDWKHGGQTTITFDGVFDVVLLHDYVLVPATNYAGMVEGEAAALALAAENLELLMVECAKTQWRPIDSWPKGEIANPVQVLLWDAERQGVTVGQWVHRGNRWCDYTDAEGDEPFHPTHWMPLPDGPIELTDLGKAYRAAMQRGAKLNGGVKAGEGE